MSGIVVDLTSDTDDQHDDARNVASSSTTRCGMGKRAAKRAAEAAHRNGAKQAVDADDELAEDTSGEVQIVSKPADPASAIINGLTAERGKTTGGDDEDVEMVGSSGAMVLPHMRFCCPETLFGKDQAVNEARCKLCYCFVCDRLASDCMEWLDHCHASDSGPHEELWAGLRGQAKRLLRAGKAVPVSGLFMQKQTRTQSLLGQTGGSRRQEEDEAEDGDSWIASLRRLFDEPTSTSRIASRAGSRPLLPPREHERWNDECGSSDENDDWNRFMQRLVSERSAPTALTGRGRSGGQRNPHFSGTQVPQPESFAYRSSSPAALVAAVGRRQQIESTSPNFGTVTKKFGCVNEPYRRPRSSSSHSRNGSSSSVSDSRYLQRWWDNQALFSREAIPRRQAGERGGDSRDTASRAGPSYRDRSEGTQRGCSRSRTLDRSRDRRRDRSVDRHRDHSRDRRRYHSRDRFNGRSRGSYRDVSPERYRTDSRDRLRGRSRDRGRRRDRSWDER